LNISKKGEFYNESFESIYKKINKVVNLFDNNGIKIQGFFAPAHGYTEELFKVLRVHPRIKLVWDGYWPSPKKFSSVNFLPQQFWNIYPRFLRPYFSGICLHPSLMSEEEIDKFICKVFRERNKDYFINFEILRFNKINIIDNLFNIIYKIIFFIKNLKYLKYDKS
jgi:hypothetical protein